MDALEKSGVIICLTTAPDVIYARLKGNTTRPLLHVPDPQATIRAMLDQRTPFYRRCSFAVATDHLTPAQIADEILLRMGDTRGVR